MLRSLRRLTLLAGLLATVAGAQTPAREAVMRGRALARQPSLPKFVQSAGALTEARRLDALAYATAGRLNGTHRLSDPLFVRLLGDSVSWRSDLGRISAIQFAQALTTRWMPDSAFSLLARAAVDARRAGDARSEGEALTSMAPLLGRRGRSDSARVLMERAAVLLPPSAPGAASRLCGLGIQLRSTSIRAADSVVQLGLQRARADADSLALARCHLSEGVVREAQGRQNDSYRALVSALQLAAAHRDEDLTGNVEQWLAYANASYGTRFADGRRYAERAIARAQRVGNPVTEAWARLNLAQVALRVGDAAVAWRTTEVAAREFRRLQDLQGESNVLVLQAQASVLGGRLQDGAALYARAESLIVRSSSASFALAPRFRRALTLVDLGFLEEAAREADSLEAVALRAGVRGIATANVPYLRARIALRRGRPDEAIPLFERFRTAVGGGTHGTMDAVLRIAEAHAAAGRFAQVDSMMALASAALADLRDERLARDDLLRIMSGQRFDSDTDLGFATIINRVAMAGRVADALAIAESERGRWLWVQRMRRSAIDSADAANDGLDDKRLDADEVRALIPARTAVVSFVTGRGGEPTTAFVVTREGARALTLAPIDSLRATIGTFVGLLESGTAATSPATSLGDALISPVLRTLPAGVTHLRLVPDGQLYHIPWDALVVGGQHLVARFVTTVAPSVRLALAPATVSTGGRVLALGDPVFDSRYGLARLPGSGDEARAVVRAAGGRGTAIVRDEARLDALSPANLGGVGVVHFATHARVQDHGLFDNAIYLTAGRLGDGRLGVAELVRTNLRVPLVVLSACRTVGGFVATGEGIQGLVGPILEAGAGAVAATYWDVRDRSLVDLMTLWYAGMARGEAAGDALASAKRELIRRGAQPRVWAAVGIVGDDRVRPLAPAPNDSRVSPARGSGAWSRRGVAR